MDHIASVVALTGGGFPRPQISTSFVKEAYKAASYFQYTGGPVDQIIGHRGGRQSTLFTRHTTTLEAET